MLWFRYGEPSKWCRGSLKGREERATVGYLSASSDLYDNVEPRIKTEKGNDKRVSKLT